MTVYGCISPMPSGACIGPGFASLIRSSHRTTTLNHALRYCENTIVIANGTMVASGKTASVITAPMLQDIYQVKARIENCSQGRALVIVDGPI